MKRPFIGRKGQYDCMNRNDNENLYLYFEVVFLKYFVVLCVVLCVV